jgi:hypothetical protein
METSLSDPSFAERLQFFWRALGPILIGVVVGLIYSFVGPRNLSRDYYSAASQIIPIVMLALAIETRVLAAAFEPGPSRRPRNRLDRLLMRHDRLLPLALVAAIMALLTVGELVALSALASKTPPHSSSLEFILAFGIAAIATVPIWRVPLGPRPHARDE